MSLDASQMHLWDVPYSPISKRTDLQISETSPGGLIKGIISKTPLRSIRFSQTRFWVAYEALIFGLQTEAFFVCCWTRTQNHLVLKRTLNHSSPVAVTSPSDFAPASSKGVPWHSDNYRLWIHSEMRTWHDKNIQSSIIYIWQFWTRCKKTHFNCGLVMLVIYTIFYMIEWF